MSHIVAGHLQQQDQVQQAIALLAGAGFARENISAFYVNPAGQHDLFPVGGDRDKSPGAKDSDVGVAAGIAAGGAVGTLVGATTIPVAGPLGPIAGGFVGAHLGSLVGSMSSMKEKGESEHGSANDIPQRKSGMMVAVCLPDPAQEEKVVRILQGQGAERIERADGTIADGNWIDFNPLSAPALI